MSDAATVQSIPQQSRKPESRPMALGQVWLRGRIKTAAQNDKGWFTTLATPASDEYSMPGVHDIQSKRSIGRPGNEVEVVCVTGGYIQNGRNSKTGEAFSITRNTLRLVEE